MSVGVENDVYKRYGNSLADFPPLGVPSGHSDKAELFCARAAWVAYSVYPTLPDDPESDSISSRFAKYFATQSVMIGQAIDPSGLVSQDFDAERGYRTVASDRAGVLMVCEQHRLVLAFRGTANWQDWIHNFTDNAIAPSYHHREERYTLHKGFTGLAANIYPAIMQRLTEYMLVKSSRQSDKTFDLIVCGHSLGGALALNFARQFNSRNFCELPLLRHPTDIGHLRLDTLLILPHKHPYPHE